MSQTIWGDVFIFPVLFFSSSALCKIAHGGDDLDEVFSPVATQGNRSK